MIPGVRTTKRSFRRFHQAGELVGLRERRDPLQFIAHTPPPLSRHDQHLALLAEQDRRRHARRRAQ